MANKKITSVTIRNKTTLVTGEMPVEQWDLIKDNPSITQAFELIDQVNEPEEVTQLKERQAQKAETKTDENVTNQEDDNEGQKPSVPVSKPNGKAAGKKTEKK